MGEGTRVRGSVLDVWGHALYVAAAAAKLLYNLLSTPLSHRLTLCLLPTSPYPLER